MVSEAEAAPVAVPAEVTAAGFEATASGILVPMKNEQDHAHDLGRFFDGIGRMEKRIPALIDFAFKVSHALAQWAGEHNVSTKQIKLGTIFWSPQGELAFDIEYDPFDITPREDPEYLKKGWARMPLLAEKFPAVLELVMTVGTHLSVMIDQKQMKGAGLSFTQLHYFKNQVSGNHAWGFVIIDRQRRRIRSRMAGL